MRKDGVSPELRAQVFERDRICFMARIHPRTHTCHTLYGEAHHSDDRYRLELDHFWLTGAHLGKRAPSDLEHLTALCGKENNRPPSHNTRESQREYIEALYPGARKREEQR